MSRLALWLLQRVLSTIIFQLLLVPGDGHVEESPDINLSTREEAGVTPDEFQQHRWVMTVNSAHNFPVTCCLHGQQMINYMETTWLASRVLDRGLIEPIFVHQARDDAVYEHMKAKGKLLDIKFHAILGTVPVAGNQLYDTWRWMDDGEVVDVAAFATNRTFWTATGGTIDLLIVGDASVIGGQACADADSWSVHGCTTLDSDPGPVPRRMEFFGRDHLVKKIICLPYTEQHLRGQIYEAALNHADTVVALALHNRHINAFAGGKLSNALFPIALVGNKSFTG